KVVDRDVLRDGDRRRRRRWRRPLLLARGRFLELHLEMGPAAAGSVVPRVVIVVGGYAPLVGIEEDFEEARQLRARRRLPVCQGAVQVAGQLAGVLVALLRVLF